MVALFRRVKWRNDLDGQFPSGCGSWAKNGCTRVELTAGECVRPESITTNNSLVFNVQVDTLLNTEIEQCIIKERSAKLMSPSDLSELSTPGNLIHVTFNSAIVGFIDDMYIITSRYKPENASSTDFEYQRVLKIMSQLRMGWSDLDVNYEHVKDILDCLNKAFDNHPNDEYFGANTPLPCS